MVRSLLPAILLLALASCGKEEAKAPPEPYAGGGPQIATSIDDANAINANVGDGSAATAAGVSAAGCSDCASETGSGPVADAVGSVVASTTVPSPRAPSRLRSSSRA